MLVELGPKLIGPDSAIFYPLLSGIELGDFPFQNRPTFQQVVTLTQKLGR